MKQAYSLLFFLLSMLVVSCSDKETEQEEYRGNDFDTIGVRMQKPMAAPDIAGDENVEDDIFYAAPMINDSFQENDLLFISQMGPAPLDPNFSDYSATASPYCYIYEYYENEDANWDYQYNFQFPLNLTSFGANRLPISWDRIRNIGSVGNSFSFYAFHFPIDNQVTWKVKTDQTADLDFMRSDIMGAYHTTSAINTRLRFNLFHLMVYLKITLYVPIYEEYTEIGNEIGYSGYEEGSFKGAYALNAATGINIEWRANRSSDIDPPFTQADYSTRANIRMHEHEYDDQQIMTLEDVKSFYPAFNGADNTDQVRVYNFSVLFPAQDFGNNFLGFCLIDKEGNNRYYYFSGSQITGDSGNYSLTQGTLQELKLYLPRKTNETILVSANVLPWNDALTDMTVNQQQPSGY